MGFLGKLLGRGRHGRRAPAPRPQTGAGAHFHDKYGSVNRIACPIHGFICITKRPDTELDETTETELIDTQWVQRLRRIHQLEAAWWVFPSGEHTRLQHGFGTMHLAGVFADHLYDSLCENLRRRNECTPSRALAVETMRIAGLLHDVGHGPFGHCFDEFWLKEKGYTHERVSTKIVLGPLSDSISSIRRSPEGEFGPGEKIEPRYVAYLVERESKSQDIPLWVRMLKPLFDGPYTCDNMDFVLRDAYMCGLACARADVARVIDYSFFPEDGDRLCLHLHGVSSLRSFLESRLELFTNVYFHRTVRAIRLHLGAILASTIDRIWPKLDLEASLDSYEKVDEWALITTVREWVRMTSGAPETAEEWAAIVNRNPQWKRVYERLYLTDSRFPEPAAEQQERCRARLDEECAGCRVDIAEAPPLQSRDLVDIFDPLMEEVDSQAWDRLGPSLDRPWRLVRVYSKDRAVTSEVHRIMADLEKECATASVRTNI